MDHVRVMIVEDEVIVAEGLQHGLRACGYDVVGCAADGQGAVDMALCLMPDLILMDVVLDGQVDGIAAARTIAGSIDSSIIYVSGHAENDLVDHAVKAGAEGYIVKPFQMCQVTAAIKLAMHRRHDACRVVQPGGPDGRAVSEEPFASAMLRLQSALADDDLWSDRAGASPGLVRSLGVTPRERQIIKGLVCYRRLSTVAHVLGISTHTARNHLKSIFRKLDLHSQDDLLRFLVDGEGA